MLTLMNAIRAQWPLVWQSLCSTACASANRISSVDFSPPPAASPRYGNRVVQIRFLTVRAILMEISAELFEIHRTKVKFPEI
jgi:hypothetical protein